MTDRWKIVPYVFEPCKDCGHDNKNGSHVHPWTCLRVLKSRVKKLEAQLAAANETATRCNEAWREERARWAGDDVQPAGDTQSAP